MDKMRIELIDMTVQYRKFWNNIFELYYRNEGCGWQLKKIITLICCASGFAQ